jgi:hypothetical protein
MVGKEIKPPYIDLDRDQEMETAVRQPFTAHELAMRRGHHPKLWAAVKGSPYEREYRRHHNIREGEDPKRFLKVQVPVAYAITWADKTGRMHISRLSGTSPDAAIETLHCGYQVLKVIEVKPIGRAAFADYQQQARASGVLYHPYSESEDPKRFLQHAAPPTQFTVDSKWEAWLVDGQGNVMSHGEAKSAGHPRWRNVKKFDVEGYKQRTGHYPTGTISIYDISYWQHDGSKISSPYEMRSFMGGPRRARQEAEDPKKLFRELPRRHDIAAFSGDWVTDREGNVLAFTPDYSASDDDPNEPDTQLELDIARYERIKKFDFDEYRAYWGDVPGTIDISDIGYWNEDGTYCKANAQYRQDIKTGGIAR